MDEVAAFLSAYPPFDQLPPAVVARVAAQAQIEYFARGQDILSYGGQPAEFLYIVRKGSVDLLREADGEVQLFDSLGPGEAFGYPSLIRNQPPIVTARAHTDTLAYLVPADTFHQLRAEQPAFANFFAASAAGRLDHAVQTRRNQADPALFQTRLADLVRRPIVAIAPDASVAEAARKMRDARVSCLLVDLPPYGVLNADSGILTDRDLRSRVLAAGLPDSTAVREVMSAPAISLPADSLVFEGLMFMLENGIHHLPVIADGEVIGMVTDSDILRQQSSSPLFLPHQLALAHTPTDLRRYTDQVAASVAALLDAGARVSDIGRVAALAHDALIQRLLRDAEADLGPPPAPYAWLVLGSEGRLEQTLRTDQDNALVYADKAPPAAAGYFAALAERVVQQLVECGFPRCPGNIMAINPQWRQPLAVWQEYFSRWIATPDEEALLRCTIFFDYRPIYGTLDVESALRPVVRRASDSRLFLARLARTALRQSAPLTLFRNVQLERHDGQSGLIDLKHRGAAMVVDLARLFALSAGIATNSTIGRLRDAWPHSDLSQIDAERLTSAFELIALLRLRHQQAQIERGEAPTNYVVYGDLSPLEQRELKESLQAVASVQRGVAMTFQTDLLA